MHRLFHGNSQFVKAPAKRWTHVSPSGQHLYELSHLLCSRRVITDTGVVPSIVRVFTSTAEKSALPVSGLGDHVSRCSIRSWKEMPFRKWIWECVLISTRITNNCLATSSRLLSSRELLHQTIAFDAFREQRNLFSLGRGTWIDRRITWSSPC
ncbi:unnamed protein product [Nippostrongylus brasiliensis]|uniref:Uncharacterized protein n=1 Tax=Nippostrongylus brasiliensis TaxID=27835 RepID=A0A0N4Y566_NIPBR|nr:unnamed protein product [Nippostrongylus brasiliensis]